MLIFCHREWTTKLCLQALLNSFAVDYCAAETRREGPFLTLSFASYRLLILPYCNLRSPGLRASRSPNGW